jgi:hypothetical protein
MVRLRNVRPSYVFQQVKKIGDSARLAVVHGQYGPVVAGDRCTVDPEGKGLSHYQSTGWAVGVS